ncbi:prolipoprotein diacylglyceryl transferase [Phenylobacterium sp.]|uniref:prolipoprotein diacylglyceryl transferase n=1 Tax=Phenylobacterium sp. TaxID=1871053 RepID=UPI002736A6EF|nr:prolipoprotein diacylglyceryl transferase [Phenylobacterium sp.]MDP3658717.1 prolipoprotein diacylglyceryl transferase [Phenylobacterium sp.]
MTFPEIDPILLRIGPLAIRWYALAYVTGILLGWRYVAGLARSPRLAPMRGPAATTPQIDDLILWLTLGIIVGGRLGHVLFYTPSLIWTNPLEILQVWRGGMSFHGGAIGVFTAIVLFARGNGLDLFRLGDLIAAAAPIGLFFGRIANFVNGELWGRPTDLPWGMVFCNPQIIETYGHCPAGLAPRHPSQLYEAALEGVVLFLILLFSVRKGMLDRRGVVAGLFLLGYGLIRIALETVREPDFGMPAFPTMGMMLSAPMVLAGAFLVWRGLREPLPATPVTGPAAGVDEPA